MKTPCSIFWFRRDLRLHDNHGLYEALSTGYDVLPVFIFDKSILDKLTEQDARVDFIHDKLNQLHKALKTKCNSGIVVRYGEPMDVF